MLQSRLSGPRGAAVLLLAALCAGCGHSRYAAHWDGRRGYDGHGDYGYDLAASRSEASQYRARAARAYPVPGTDDDPWGPHIREAAARFQVPERWVRAVMQQESGGRQYETDGSLITSSAGAMGLMQVVPATFDILRRRYGLGDDPYEPRDNILAGTAYIREMYDRFGAPNFLAAYNAGPDRTDAWLSGGMPLPDETTNYMASVAPMLGMDGGTAVVAAAQDSSYRAFDGGGLVSPSAPTGEFSARASPVPAVVQPVVAVAPPRGDWAIQVGTYPDPANAHAAITAARGRIGDLLGGAQEVVTPVQRSGLLYRARLVGLSADAAGMACARLEATGMDCFTVPPGS
jgi:hypothetical protein